MPDSRPSEREQFVALVNRVAELLAPDKGYDELAECVWDEWVRVPAEPAPPDEKVTLQAENARLREALEDVAFVTGGKAAERIHALLRGNP